AVDEIYTCALARVTHRVRSRSGHVENDVVGEGTANRIPVASGLRVEGGSHRICIRVSHLPLLVSLRLSLAQRCPDPRTTRTIAPAARSRRPSSSSGRGPTRWPRPKEHPRGRPCRR